MISADFTFLFILFCLVSLESMSSQMPMYGLTSVFYYSGLLSLQMYFPNQCIWYSWLMWICREEIWERELWGFRFRAFPTLADWHYLNIYSALANVFSLWPLNCSDFSLSLFNSYGTWVQELLLSGYVPTESFLTWLSMLSQLVSLL